MSYEEIVTAALALPEDARAMLAEQLLESLDTENQARINALWVEEAERRDREIDEGKVKAVPVDEVMERLRSRYK